MNKWQIEAVKEDGVQINFSFSEQEHTTAVFADAKMERKEPYFGLQPYFDGRRGVSFQIDGLEAEKLLVIYQHKDWWVRPAFADSLRGVPERSQLVLIKHKKEYTAFLAVCGEECRTDFSGGSEKLNVTMASNAGNRNRISGLCFVCAWGADPYECCGRACAYALEQLGHPQMKRERRRYPEMLEYFGWCSWDAFYHQVSEQGLLEKMEELKEKEIPVNWVLIDDGWLDADYEQQVLRGLDAEKEKFPEGLAACVKKLKSRYSIRQVGVWHAIMGCWNGLEEKSAAAAALADGVTQLPDGRIVPAPDAGKAFRFYDKWHSYLKETCGIDFVKVDGQSSVSLFYAGMESYGKASAAIQKGLAASAALHFDNNIINCMGMAGEDLWNRPSSAVSRSSDDFVPNVPRGFCEHALQNSYNSLLQGQFFWGDWDMFWSGHEENRQNSILRAVSGGPVYVSDAVGKTDGSYIRPLIFSDGRIIRCDSVGMPTADCLFENPAAGARPLKVFNRKGDCYVIAAFSVNQAAANCSGTIRLSDIPKPDQKEYIVYSWNEKTAAVLKENQSLNFELTENNAALFVLLPVQGDGRILGLTDKYIGIGAVEYEEKTQNHWRALLKEGGEIGIWSQRPVRKILCGGKEVPFERKGELYLTEYDRKEKVIVEVFPEEQP